MVVQGLNLTPHCVIQRDSVGASAGADRPAAFQIQNSGALRHE